MQRMEFDVAIVVDALGIEVDVALYKYWKGFDILKRG